MRRCLLAVWVIVGFGSAHAQWEGSLRTEGGWNVNGHWRDSVQYRQSYYYNALSTEPYLHLTYSLGKFDFQVMERVQVYRHAVTNDCACPNGW